MKKIVCIKQAYLNISNVFLDGWVGGWLAGWLEVKAVLRIAHSNKKCY
jgi:hypothetical protein